LAVQAFLDQQGMGSGEELGVVLEMLTGRLHCMYNVGGGKLLALEAGDADEQPFIRANCAVSKVDSRVIEGVAQVCAQSRPKGNRHRKIVFTR
jgi:hypothetical protein